MEDTEPKPAPRLPDPIIAAFTQAATAIEHLPLDKRQAVIAALRALWPDKPNVVAQALPEGWHSGGQTVSPKYGL